MNFERTGRLEIKMEILKVIVNNPAVNTVVGPVADRISKTDPSDVNRFITHFIVPAIAASGAVGKLERALQAGETENYVYGFNDTHPIGSSEIGLITGLQKDHFNKLLEKKITFDAITADIHPKQSVDKLAVEAYAMNGETGDAPFVVLYDIDETTEKPKGPLYVCFGLEQREVEFNGKTVTEDLLKPPTIFNEKVFFPLNIIPNPADVNSQLIAVVNENTGGIYPLFDIKTLTDENGNVTFSDVLFIPPYIEGPDFQDGVKVSGSAKFAIPRQIKETTESPLPAEFKDLQDRLGENFKLYDTGEKDKEGKFIMGMKDKDGNIVENVRCFADGTTSFIYNGTDLTIASVVIDAEHLGPWHIESGEIIIDTSPAPKTVEDAKLLPRQALIKDHPKWAEMDKTNRLYDQWSMKKTNIYDPIHEFKGIVINGEEADLSDISSKIWQVQDFGRSDDVFIVPVNNSPVLSSRIAIGSGWTKLEVYDLDGRNDLDLIRIPIVNLGTNDTLITSGLIKEEKLQDVLNQIDGEGRNGISTALSRDPKITIASTLDILWSDEELRQFMADYNKYFFEQNILEEIMTQLPPELGQVVYFDFAGN